MSETNTVTDVVQNETSIKTLTRFGRFTIAEVEIKQIDPVKADSERKVVGIGIARLGDNDKFRKEIGDAIAIARAKRAATKKLLNKKINATLLG